MARTRKPKLVKLTIRITLDDQQALDSIAQTLERDASWVLAKLAHLSAGTVDLSVEVRRWLRGDTAFDAGLKGDQKALLVIGNDDPPVARAERRKTVAQAPPSVEEVHAYIMSMGYGFAATDFIDHYTANGWKQASGNPLLDWKHACRSPWQRNWLEKNPQAAAVSDWGAGRPAELDAPVDDRTATLPLEDAEPEQDGYLEDPEA